ncbi:MAG: hypothetical protein Q8N06_07260 [Hydrogenophaga sp.]|nr:hypothetical protein [Hydrogenophaga sp.]
MSTVVIASGWEFELHPLSSAERKAPEYLRRSVEHGTEALDCVARMVLGGAAAPSLEVLEHLVQVAQALLQRLRGEAHAMLPAPAAKPDGSLQVDCAAPGAERALCDWAYASAIRPLMSLEAQAVLADLGPQSLAAMKSAVANFDGAVQRLGRLAGGNT